VGTLPLLTLRNIATNFSTPGTPGCFQYHSNIQTPMRASAAGRQAIPAPAAFRHVDLLVEAKLHDLLEGS